VGWAIVAALVTGTLAGMLNAFGVTVLRVPPIIMTLGTLGIYRGLMRIITGGSWIENLPQSIKEPNLWSFAGVPFFVWLTALVIAATAYWTLRARPARYVGTPLGAAVGALFLTAVHSMLIFLGVPGIWDNAFAGVILLAVVYVDYRVRSTLESQRRQARIRGDTGGGAS